MLFYCVSSREMPYLCSIGARCRPQVLRNAHVLWTRYLWLRIFTLNSRFQMWGGILSATMQAQRSRSMAKPLPIKFHRIWRCLYVMNQFFVRSFVVIISGLFFCNGHLFVVVVVLLHASRPVVCHIHRARAIFEMVRFLVNSSRILLYVCTVCVCNTLVVILEKQSEWPHTINHK